jgi:hypothetical protein
MTQRQHVCVSRYLKKWEKLAVIGLIAAYVIPVLRCKGWL